MRAKELKATAQNFMVERLRGYVIVNRDKKNLSKERILSANCRAHENQGRMDVFFACRGLQMSKNEREVITTGKVGLHP